MASSPSTVRSASAMRKRAKTWRDAGETIALVPTMGALHDGHLSLVDMACKKAGRVIVSIFVNPKQFGPSEDFSRYPRDTAADIETLAGYGVDTVYAPSVERMYGQGFATEVRVRGFTDVLCGATRPGHFAGVTTVVAKLFIACAPDIAIFGEKDYQQLLVIRRMARDLDLPVKVLGGRIVREVDGLALSSRNRYLTPAQRAKAPFLNRTLHDVASGVAEGRAVDEATAAGRARLEKAGFAVDYVEVLDGDTLDPLAEGGRGRAFGAVWLGETRLIDNIPVSAPAPKSE